MPLRGACTGGQGGVHREKEQGNLTGVLEGHQVTVRRGQEGELAAGTSLPTMIT